MTVSSIIIIWWLIGFIPSLIAFSEDSDVRLNDLLKLIFVGIFGPIIAIIAIPMIFNFKNPIIFKKRGKK